MISLCEIIVLTDKIIPPYNDNVNTYYEDFFILCKFIFHSAEFDDDLTKSGRAGEREGKNPEMI